MSNDSETRPTIALLWRGALTDHDPFTRNPRMRPIFVALQDAGLAPQIILYGEAFEDEVRDRLRHVDAVLVWVDPLDDGQDRRRLDPLLREMADAGVWVSAHPDTILKIGTKEVLFQTRNLGWGTDTHLYATRDSFVAEFPHRVRQSGTRVLKQYRGNGGLGVWRVERTGDDTVRVVQGRHGQVPEELPLAVFMARCAPYFDGSGRLIDQAYQPRIREGLIRCYFVQNEVVGFARQVHAKPDDSSGLSSPVLFGLPSAKTMFAADDPQFAMLRHKAQTEWVPGMQRLLDIPTTDLPVIWDADFLFGPKTAEAADSYVLCEINVSCVLPIPPAAPERIARAVTARLAG